MLEEAEPASTKSGVALQNVEMQFRPGLGQKSKFIGVLD